MNEVTQTQDQTLLPVQTLAQKTDAKGALKAATVTGLAVASITPAFAAIDTSAVMSLITEGAAAAVVIGVAWLGFNAGISIYKKLRAAI